jgi:hypothetical protein
LELGEYNFVMESFSEDIIKIRKWDIEIKFILETGEFELFINQQLLFVEDDLTNDSSKFTEVKWKLEMFLELVTE